MASAVNNTEHELVVARKEGDIHLSSRVLTVLDEDEAKALREHPFFKRLVDSGIVTFNDNVVPVQDSKFVDTVAETAERGKEEIQTVEAGDTIVASGTGERAATVTAHKQRSRAGVVTV